MGGGVDGTNGAEALAPGRTTWLGAPIRTAPTDLLAYREILSRVRPDWVVEISSNDEGRAAFLASICELVAHGRVLSIHSSDDGALPQHARLQCFSGAPLDLAVRDRVHAIVGGGNAVVLLGACAARATTAAQFEAYFDLIGVGSYAIVTDTIVNGRPVWTLFGPGPGEAVKQILTRHGEFVADPEMGKYALTFNPGRFLRRVRSRADRPPGSPRPAALPGRLFYSADDVDGWARHAVASFWSARGLAPSGTRPSRVARAARTGATGEHGRIPGTGAVTTPAIQRRGHRRREARRAPSRRPP